MAPGTPDILARIVARKREELRVASVPVADLRTLADQARRTPRSFAGALRGAQPAIISEIKKASPSKGLLIEDFRPADLALRYEQGGAAALSVLTDHDFFQGSIDDLKVARAACALPVLRKDFTLADYHVLEAAAAGADAILLIVAILDDTELRSLRQLAAEFQMDALVEVHDAAELDRALKSDATIIGVNNRDLRTFQVTLNTSLALAPRIPAGVIKVSESGICGSADIRLLERSGFDAFLVGEHLLRSSNAEEALRELVV